MGGPCELRLYGVDASEVEHAAQVAIAEVVRIETKFSRYTDTSVTAAIHRRAGDPAGIEVDPETAALLDYADVAHRESGGRFDITSGVLRGVWDFRSGKLPQSEAVRETLLRVGWERVRWKRPRLVLPEPGMELDFGGYGKEYAVDRAAGVLAGLGVRHGLVDLGGDLFALGPHPDGTPWAIGIRHPRKPERPVATVPLARGGLATSGDYERFVEVDGRRYCHILDPRTGWPVEGLASVSVLAPRCLVAGTTSTIAMLHGTPAGPRWLAATGLPHLHFDTKGEIGGTIATA